MSARLHFEGNTRKMEPLFDVYDTVHGLFDSLKGRVSAAEQSAIQETRDLVICFMKLAAQENRCVKLEWLLDTVHVNEKEGEEEE
jgi:hypothetical protein